MSGTQLLDNDAVKDKIRTQNDLINKKIAELEDEITQLKSKRRCAYCGKVSYYARNMCANCYAKNRNREITRKKRESSSAMALEHRIYKTIFGEENEVVIPSNFLEKFEDVLERLTERQQFVIRGVLYDGLSLAEIARVRGTSRANETDAYRSALHILQNSENTIILKTIGSKDLTLKSSKYYLGLSTNTNNALTRAGCETIEDVIALMPECYKGRVRGIGSMRAEEIQKKITDFLEATDE